MNCDDARETTAMDDLPRRQADRLTMRATTPHGRVTRARQRAPRALKAAGTCPELLSLA